MSNHCLTAAPADDPGWPHRGRRPALGAPASLPAALQRDKITPARMPALPGAGRKLAERAASSAPARRRLRPKRAEPMIVLVSLWWRLAVQDTVSCSGKP